MFAPSITIPRDRSGPALFGLALGAAGTSVVFGLLIPLAYQGESPRLTLVVVGGLGLLGVLALSLARYEAAVALGFVLLGVVTIEPAPPDAVFAIVIAVALVTGRFAFDRVPLVATGLLTVFLALNLLSATEAVDEASAIRFFLITLYLAAFAAWLAGYLNSARRARLLVRAYLIGAVTVAALSSLGLFVPFPGHEVLATPDGLRAKGLFQDPNVFGPFLVPAAFLLIEELLTPRLLRLNRPMKWTLLFTIAVAILVSYSRAAWLNAVLGMVVMLIVLLLRRGGGRRAMVLVVTAASLAVILGVTITTTGSADFLADRARFQAYDVDRFGAQAAAPSLAEEHPFGIGPGQFELVAPLGAHSLYARTLAEQGFLGVTVILALLTFTFGLACRNAALGRHTWGIGSSALLAAWCGLLVNSAFVDTLHWRHLWVVAALIWAGATRRS